MSKRSATLTGTQYIATAFFSCTASNEVLLPSGKVIFVNLGILMYRVMQQQMRSIEEARPPKHRCFLLFPYVCHIYVKKNSSYRGKCGILGFVANFMEFAETTEKIFGDSDRKGDLEKW